MLVFLPFPIYTIKTSLSVIIALIVIFAYGSIALLLITLLTALPALVLASAIGYDIPDTTIDQYEIQRRFDLKMLPTISERDYDRLASLDEPLKFSIKKSKVGSLCITREWDQDIYICIIKSDIMNFLYVFPMPVYFPCKNSFYWFHDGCSKDIYQQDFDYQARQPYSLPEGWYYSPEYGLERVVFHPKAKPPPPE